MVGHRPSATWVVVAWLSRADVTGLTHTAGVEIVGNTGTPQRGCPQGRPRSYLGHSSPQSEPIFREKGKRQRDRSNDAPNLCSWESEELAGAIGAMTKPGRGGRHHGAESLLGRPQTTGRRSHRTDSLPAVYPWREFCPRWRIMSYDVDRSDVVRRPRRLRRQDLQRGKAGRSPHRTPTKFDLVINLRPEGPRLSIPQSLLSGRMRL